ncbi:hypothetical protein KW796_01830 [Candidatus Parcubacteria bacterium]|nr:hypothetical protein [Candidatus Parcubacteria bacterium]
MLKPNEFEKVVDDLLFTHSQLLLNGYLHKRVTSEAYGKNIYTWNTLLLSLEKDVILGLDKILDKKFFGGLNSDELRVIGTKISKVRNHFAHINLNEIIHEEAFFKANGLTGSEIIKMIDALKNLFIQNEKNVGSKINVQELFNETTRNIMNDLDSWLKSFKTSL